MPYGKKDVLITLDAGNTSIFMGAYKGRKLLRTRRIIYANIPDKTLEKEITGFYGRFYGCVEGAVISSVVPCLNRVLRSILMRKFSIKPFFVNSDVNGLMKILCEKPQKLGADRIAVAVGAKALYGCPLIVVDFGTAVTFDFIDKKGNYRGGAIAAGVWISCRALAEKTALLPEIKFSKPLKVIGANTVDCIKSGIYYGFTGSVKEIITRMKKEIGYNAKVVATGGYGSGILREAGILCRTNEDLVHEGMRIIWKRNQGRSQIDK